MPPPRYGSERQEKQLSQLLLDLQYACHRVEDEAKNSSGKTGVMERSFLIESHRILEDSRKNVSAESVRRASLYAQEMTEKGYALMRKGNIDGAEKCLVSARSALNSAGLRNYDIGGTYELSDDINTIRMDNHGSRNARQPGKPF